MASIQEKVLSVLLLFLLYEGGVMEREPKLTDFSLNDDYCQGSPLDFIKELIGGPATLFLPEAVLNITLSVEIQYHARNGIKVLKLHPVMMDEKRCVNYPVDPIRLCYEYSEIHWGKTDEEGSDHSIQGYSYPMEIQHYFRRTDFVNHVTPVAVAVLYDMKSRSSQIGPGSLWSAYNDISKQGFFKNNFHEDMEPMYLHEVMKPIFSSDEDLEHMHLPQMQNFKEKKNLRLGDLLPEDIKTSPFYQYRGTVSGSCGEERDWIVFADTLDVPYTFLNFLRSFGSERDDHHFQEIQGYGRCILYSHNIPFSTLVTTCEISPPVSVTIPLIPESLLEGKTRKESITPQSYKAITEPSPQSSEVVSVGPRAFNNGKSEPPQMMNPEVEKPKPSAEVETTEESLDDEKTSTIPEFSPVLRHPSSDGKSHPHPLELEAPEEPELITAPETTTDAIMNTTEDSSCVGKLRPGLFFLFLGILICFA